MDFEIVKESANNLDPKPVYSADEERLQQRLQQVRREIYVNEDKVALRK